jgi:hypothetical protein
LKAIFLILVSLFFSITQELPEVREQYYSASKSKENAEKFYDLLSKYNKDNKVLLAYKGAATALKSKYTTDRKLKKELFIEGVSIVEKAIKNDPNNAEIRLIRLSIQENTPKILKYKANIEEDKKSLLSTFDKQSQSLKEYIKIYAKQSKVFSEKEKQVILK